MLSSWDQKILQEENIQAEKWKMEIGIELQKLFNQTQTRFLNFSNLCILRKCNPHVFYSLTIK